MKKSRSFRTTLKWRREGDLKISASLEIMKFQGRSDVPLPVYPEVYPKSLQGLSDYLSADTLKITAPFDCIISAGVILNPLKFTSFSSTYASIIFSFVVSVFLIDISDWDDSVMFVPQFGQNFELDSVPQFGQTEVSTVDKSNPHSGQNLLSVIFMQLDIFSFLTFLLSFKKAYR